MSEIGTSESPAPNHTLRNVRPLQEDWITQHYSGAMG